MIDYFKIYEFCRIIKGYTRSAIYDLERGKHCLVPNLMCEMVCKYDKHSLDEIYTVSNQNNTIKSYIQYLIENYFAFICSKNSIDNFSSITNRVGIKKAVNLRNEYDRTI